mmetsp:Transcript_23079/g.65014  ORF Transcript_23079/g.65014 Transcript_23079/m.65014 type:complete len:219 (-) Transcript_23079:76-732(-)
MADDDEDSPTGRETRNFIIRNIPNAITFVTVFSGFLLMVSTSVPGISPNMCVFATFLGLCTDILDGQAARVLRVKSKFGATFDQLADLTCFGIGPAIFYVRQQQLAMGNDASVMMQAVTVVSGYAYMACSVFRISRELVVHRGDRPLYFVGIPTNLACVFAVPASALYPGSPLLPVLIIILSGMMVMPYHVPKGLWIFTVTDTSVASACQRRSSDKKE